MLFQSNRKSVYFFTILCGCLVVLAVALNIGWIVFHWRQVALLIFGVLFFLLIIAGLVLNTIYLIREIRRNEQHDSFINAVTHELKTPIASIRLYLETLGRHELSEEKRQEFYKVMLLENDRLLHTVEQVLRASRSGYQKRAFHAMPVELSALAPECVQLAGQRMNLPGTALRYTSNLAAGEAAWVEGDAEELRTAITNLIDNAIKYSVDQVKVTVELDVSEADRISIRVTDQGIGIPRGELKQIFKRFYRVPRRVANRVKGTGLGLFIVRSVITKHGGKAFAESLGEGLGSTFTIQLPRIQAPAGQVGTD
ncbi:MAG: sensor histidine kinase [Acidobacteria bacterium]|nr:sensor histidine kinase [Acidobacteriota bacterium]